MKICENKKLIRHSLDYYQWLKNAMIKRNCKEIWVEFSKTKAGLFTLKQVKEYLRKERAVR